MESSCTSQTGDPTSRVKFSDSSFEFNPLPEPMALGLIWSRKPSLPLSSGTGILGADQKDSSLWERDCVLSKSIACACFD